MKLNLFDLTAEQEATSKALYGKAIKCLIAPYHSYNELENMIPYDRNTFLFPEREMNVTQCRQFISILSHKPGEEFRVVTTDMNIICDMVDSSVRILTSSGKIVESPCKTFAANIHDIRYNILENQVFNDKVEDDSNFLWKNNINAIINKLNSPSITRAEYNSIEKQISDIGEDVIRNVLKNHLDRANVV